MMRRFKATMRQFCAIVATIMLPFSAAAQELVTGLSHETIYITSDFTGSELVVFGAINNLGSLAGSQDENVTMGNYDIVVVIEGPPEEGTVRKKDRTLGIWINDDSVTFEMIPASYLMMTSEPHDEKALNAALKALNIGLGHTSFGALKNNAVSTSPQDFRKAVIRLKMNDGLYSETTGISFLGDNLFRARFEIPALIPIGNHTVNSYLLVDNELISQSSHTIEITKTGFEQFMYNFSREYGYLYGVFCVILAIVTGWVSSIIFRRD